MMVLGVLGSGLAFIAAASLGARAGPGRGSIPIYFLPVVAMLLGALVRDESIPALAMAGVGLVIAGLAQQPQRAVGPPHAREPAGAGSRGVRRGGRGQS